MKKQLLALTLLAAAASLKAQNPYPIIPIDSVQYVSPQKLSTTPINDKADYVAPAFMNTQYRDTVRFEGVVVSNPKIYGLSTSRKAAYIQRLGGGPWSGVLAMADPNPSGEVRIAPDLQTLLNETKFYENLVPGFKVRVTGVIRNFDGTNGLGVQGETQINMIRNNANWENSVEQIDFTPVTPVYSVITIDSLMTGNTTAGNIAQKKVEGEKWEGVLVELRNVTVNSSGLFNGNRWNWTVIDQAGNEIAIRDVSSYFRNDDNEDTVPKIPNNFTPPVIGTGLSYLRGVIIEYRQATGVYRYGIVPLTPDMVGPCAVCPPRIALPTRNPQIATAANPVKISSVITDQSGIDSASLFYAVGASTNFTKLALAKEGTTDIWSAEIPAQAANSVVKYYIKATNANHITVTFPDTLASGSNYLVTDSGINNIRTLQFSNVASYTSIWNGDSLTGMDVRGIVTATRMNDAAQSANLTVVQDGQGPNSAIFIQNNDVTSKWVVGDSVQITGARLRENFNVTTLYNVTGNLIQESVALPQFETELSLDSFAMNNVSSARKWEGVLIRFDSVFVIRTNADSTGPTSGNFGEWSFAHDMNAPTNKALRADDINVSILSVNRTLTQGQFFEFIQGPMHFSFSNFKIAPRNYSDIGLCNLDTIKPVLSMNGNTNDTIEVGSNYNDQGITAIDARNGDLGGYVITSSNLNSSVIGDYTIKYVVSDFCGNMDSLTRWIHVKDTPTVGLNKNELTAADIKVYPSPATDVITISAKDIKTLPLTVAVYDVVGREMLTRTYIQNNVSDSINITSLNSGVYFCVIKNAQGSRTIKFMVNGK